VLSHPFPRAHPFPCADLFIALIFSLVAYRRRRAARAGLAYVQQHQLNGGSAYNGYDGLPPYAPQYQLQAQGSPGGVPDYAYDPNAGFAPVRPTSSPPVPLPDQ